MIDREAIKRLSGLPRVSVISVEVRHMRIDDEQYFNGENFSLPYGELDNLVGLYGVTGARCLLQSEGLVVAFSLTHQGANPHTPFISGLSINSVRDIETIADIAEIFYS